MSRMTRSAHGLSTPCGDWWSRAACGGKNPNWWDLAYTQTLSPDNERALEVCAACPVREPCDAEAERLGETGLIRGGRPRWVEAKPNSFRRQDAPPTQQRGCGTLAGVSRHRTAGEQCCGPCRDARSLDEAVRRLRHRQGDPAFHQCSQCDGLFRLKRSGVLHPHKAFSWETGYSTELCAGSRRAERVLLGTEEGR